MGSFWVKNGRKKVEIEGGGTYLARSAPKFCGVSRPDCAKRLDGDPIGAEKV